MPATDDFLRRSLLRLSLVLFSGLGLVSCVEPFDPAFDDDGIHPVVEALITDSPGIQTVLLSWSAPLNDTARRGISGAHVALEGDGGTGIEFAEEASGTYRGVLTELPERTEAFQLRIVLSDGRQYLSDSQRYPPASPPIDSLYWEFEDQITADPDAPRKGIRFFLDMEGGEDQSRHYRWELEETWRYHAPHHIQYVFDGEFQPWSEPYVYATCYRTRGVGQIFLGSTLNLVANRLDAQPLLYVSNETRRLQSGYNLRVRQLALTPEAHAYWNQVADQSQGTGGLYQSQPSAIATNLCNPDDPTEQVLGYFHLCSLAEKRIHVPGISSLFYPPQDCILDTMMGVNDKPAGLIAPFYAISLNEMGSGPPYGVGDDECFDCRTEGGTLTQPDFWE